MNQHKLVVSPTLINHDYESTHSLPPEKQNQYRLFHQMTRLSRDRGSLVHDDRLDVLSMAVGYWVMAAGLSAEEQMKQRRDEQLDEELDKIIHGNHPLYGDSVPPLIDTWM